MPDDKRLNTGMLVMALMRSLETYRPKEKQLFDGSFAKRLLPPLWRALLLPGPRHALMAIADRHPFGAIGNVYCRTRYIDEALKAALVEGIDQVVNLGAGFDTRAYHIPGVEKTRVFELDLPTPQRKKQELLVKVLGSLPAHVTFVPIDFDRQSTEEALAAAGFRAGARTFFIWEGVTQYIAAEAVDSTFRFVARAGAPGSQIAFTYIPLGIIDGTARSEVDARIIARVKSSPTPWVNGIDPATLREYLAARGLAFIEEADVAYYRAHYLAPIGREMTIYDGERMALARVV